MDVLVLGRKVTSGGSRLASHALVRLSSDGRWRYVIDNLSGIPWGLKQFVVPSTALRLLFFIMGADIVFAYDVPAGGPLYVSRDGGKTWGVVSSFPNNCHDITMAADGTLWAISDERAGNSYSTNGSQFSKIYKSTDFGETWELSRVLTEESSGSNNCRAFVIAAHPTDPNKIIVGGTSPVGISPARFWRTTNGGQTWQFVQPSGASPAYNGQNRALSYLPNGNLIYGRGIAGLSPSAVVMSSDNGSTWSSVYTFNSHNQWPQSVSSCGKAFVASIGGLVRLSQTGALEAVRLPPSGLGFSSVVCYNDEVFVGAFPLESGIPTIEKTDPDWRGWTSIVGSMLSDLGYYIAPNWQGVMPVPPIEAPGTPPPGTVVDEAPCIPIIGLEVTADATSIYSRSRAFGLGLNNADGMSTAHNVARETEWSPESGHYLVQREIQINDYGVTERQELKNLADSYLVDPSEKLKGFTIARITVPSLPVSDNASMLGKPLQAGDSISINSSLVPADLNPSGLWVVDSLTYYWPEDITEIIASNRSAALVEGPGGNVRTLGMAGAGEGEFWESDWIPPLLIPVTGEASCVAIQHNIGVVPSRILVIGADSPIENWYDDTEVDQKNIIVVPPLHYDPDRGWIGFRIVQSDGNALVMAVAQILQVLDDGEVFVTDKFLKVFLFP